MVLVVRAPAGSLLTFRPWTTASSLTLPPMPPLPWLRPADSVEDCCLALPQPPGTVAVIGVQGAELGGVEVPWERWHPMVVHGKGPIVPLGSYSLENPHMSQVAGTNIPRFVRTNRISLFQFSCMEPPWFD